MNHNTMKVHFNHVSGLVVFLLEKPFSLSHRKVVFYITEPITQAVDVYFGVYLNEVALRTSGKQSGFCLYYNSISRINPGRFSCKMMKF